MSEASRRSSSERRSKVERRQRESVSGSMPLSITTSRTLTKRDIGSESVTSMPVRVSAAAMRVLRVMAKPI